MTATVEPRFNETLYNEVLGLTVFMVRYMTKEPRYDETST